MSIAWAVGAGFYQKFGNLAKCIDAQDWEGCVATCKIREDNNPGVVPRNAKNRFCFHNAAVVAANTLPAERLWWPEVAQAGFHNVDGESAKAEAELALAAWHALDTCPYSPPGSGAATIDYENGDTDPSELAPESQP
jgi:hypothetical protein